MENASRLVCVRVASGLINGRTRGAGPDGVLNTPDAQNSEPTTPRCIECGQAIFFHDREFCSEKCRRRSSGRTLHLRRNDEKWRTSLEKSAVGLRKPKKPRVCVHCGNSFVPTAKGARGVAQKFCSHTCFTAQKKSQRRARFVSVQCLWCGTTFLRTPARPKQRFCGTRCSSFWRNRLPHIAAGHAASGKRLGALPRSEHWREVVKEQMRIRNPMWKEGIKEKMVAKMRGRTFLGRGGNGEPTKPQLMLAHALGWPMEVPIATAPVIGEFPSLPHCYKVDVGHPETKLAVEVDGKTHKLKRWRFLDKRKEQVLAALRWKVLRFTNEQVLQDLPGVVQTILAEVARCRNNVNVQTETAVVPG